MKTAGAKHGARNLDSYEDTVIAPIWPDVLWRGKYTLLAGDAGLGKSTVCADVIARVTTGQTFPCSAATNEPGSVLMLSAEDDVGDTIKPRLKAAGADLKRVHIIELIEGQWPSLRDHLEQLRNEIEKAKAVLLVVDPISAYLGDIDSHRTGDVRAVLGPLKDVLQGTRCALLAVSHPNKDRSAKALHRVTGSQAFVDASRATFCIGERSESPGVRFMVPLKNNLSVDKPGFDFTLVDANGYPRVEWSKMPTYDKADELLSNASNAEALEEAVHFLSVELQSGPALVKELKKRAADSGHAWRTVERARKTLGIGKPEWTVDGWQWCLPAAPETPAPGGAPPDSEPCSSGEFESDL